MTATRTLVAALAAATLAAPSALAQPIDLHGAVAQPAAKTSGQDLRSPDARDAATRPGSALAQDVRHLRAGGDATQRPLVGPPTWPAQPHVITAPSTPAEQPGDGVDLATIGLGIAGSLLAVGALAGIANRTRRPQRRRAIA
jgi:hypothetical protein